MAQSDDARADPPDAKERANAYSSNSAADFLKPIVSQTRNTAVLDALAGMIENAGLTVGDRIPSETLIARRLQVSRSTIREALKGWESLGIIRRRRGAGTYLAIKISPHTLRVPFTLQLEGDALLRTTQARRALEVAAVRDAAINATVGQRQLVQKTYSVLADTLAAKLPWRPADAAFHTAIYDASGNPLFGQLIRQLDAAFHSLYVVPFGNEDTGDSSFPIHGELCDAVVAADPDGAVAAIEAIIDILQADIKQVIS